MTSIQVQILLVAWLTVIATSTLGVFLVLRSSALISDAISHSVLLGIVIAALFTGDLSSPFLIIGAGLSGVLLVVIIESLDKTHLITNDISMGIIYPLFFSVSVILINVYAKNVHIDTHVVLLGELAYVPFDTMLISAFNFTIALPKALIIMLILAVINVGFVVFFHKQLAITTFDPNAAMILGISPAIYHYALMTLISFTTVGAFNAVGAILVIAFIIGPPATAFLLTNKLSHMLYLSVLIGFIATTIGLFLAFHFNTTLAGVMALVIGIIYLLCFLLSPKEGVWIQIKRRREEKLFFYKKILLIHLFNHANTKAEQIESNIHHFASHLNWKDSYAKKIYKNLIKSELIFQEGDLLKLTDKGLDAARQTRDGV